MPKTVKRRKNKLAGRYRNRWPDEAEISGRMIPKWVADSCRNRWPDHPEIRSSELDIKIGDILFCEVVEKSSKLVMTKHSNQTLSDADIAYAGNLTRVIFLPSSN